MVMLVHIKILVTYGTVVPYCTGSLALCSICTELVVRSVTDILNCCSLSSYTLSNFEIRYDVTSVECVLHASNHKTCVQCMKSWQNAYVVSSRLHTPLQMHVNTKPPNVTRYYGIYTVYFLSPTTSLIQGLYIRTDLLPGLVCEGPRVRFQREPPSCLISHLDTECPVLNLE